MKVLDLKIKQFKNNNFMGFTLEIAKIEKKLKNLKCFAF